MKYITKQITGLRDAPGLHGAGLVKNAGQPNEINAQIWEGVVIECGKEINDKYIQIIGPAPMIDPVTLNYLDYGKNAWVELAHVAPYEEQGGGDATRYFKLTIPPAGQGMPTVSELAG